MKGTEADTARLSKVLVCRPDVLRGLFSSFCLIAKRSSAFQEDGKSPLGGGLIIREG